MHLLSSRNVGERTRKGFARDPQQGKEERELLRGDKILFSTTFEDGNITYVGKEGGGRLLKSLKV